MGQTVYLLFVIHHVVPGDLYRNWKKEDNCIHTLSKVECKHKVPHSYQLGPLRQSSDARFEDKWAKCFECKWQMASCVLHQIVRLLKPPRLTNTYICYAVICWGYFCARSWIHTNTSQTSLNTEKQNIPTNQDRRIGLIEDKHVLL